MDTQGQGVKPSATADLQDPEIKKEAERIKIKMMRLVYYKELAGVIVVWLQAFKAEAVSLVTGVGTIVMGYYRIKKWVLKNRAEIKDMRSAQPLRKVEARVELKAVSHAGKTKAKLAKPTAKPQEVQATDHAPPALSMEDVPRFGVDDATFIGLSLAFGLTIVHFIKRQKKTPETTNS